MSEMIRECLRSLFWTEYYMRMDHSIMCGDAVDVRECPRLLLHENLAADEVSLFLQETENSNG